MLALGELTLLGEGLGAEPDDRDPVGGELQHVVPKGAALGGAAARAGDVIPALRQWHPGDPSHGVHVDHYRPDRCLAKVEAVAERGVQLLGRQLASGQMIGGAIVKRDGQVERLHPIVIIHRVGHYSKGQRMCAFREKRTLRGVCRSCRPIE